MGRARRDLNPRSAEPERRSSWWSAIRKGRALFTVDGERVEATGGQVLVVPAFTPHKFAVIGPAPFVSTNIHANPTFVTEWLE